MSPETVTLQPLERGYLRVLRIRAMIGWLLFAAMVSVADAILHLRLGLPFGLLSGPVLALGVASVAFFVPRRWRRWSHAFTGRELHVSKGWLVRTRTVVPVSRVQHIDVSQGPLERSVGVATLVLHTAGTEGNRVRLPGIRRERAEEIRDLIRGQIEDTAW